MLKGQSQEIFWPGFVINQVILVPSNSNSCFFLSDTNMDKNGRSVENATLMKSQEIRNFTRYASLYCKKTRIRLSIIEHLKGQGHEIWFG